MTADELARKCESEGDCRPLFKVLLESVINRLKDGDFERFDISHLREQANLYIAGDWGKAASIRSALASVEEADYRDSLDEDAVLEEGESERFRQGESWEGAPLIELQELCSRLPGNSRDENISWISWRSESIDLFIDPDVDLTI